MAAQEHMAEVLAALGLTADPEMADTPTRFTEFLEEFADRGGPPVLSTFAVSASGPVTVRDVPYHSLCAHHLLPFFGHATICYQPGSRVAGLGGIARVIEHYSRRPQLQERLAEQIADALQRALTPVGLVVHLTARQMCMEMRGARSAGTVEVLAHRGDAASLLASLPR